MSKYSQKTNILSEISRVDGYIFTISMVVFLVGSLPASYNAGYIAGAGTTIGGRTKNCEGVVGY